MYNETHNDGIRTKQLIDEFRGSNLDDREDRFVTYPNLAVTFVTRNRY